MSFGNSVRVSEGEATCGECEPARIFFQEHRDSREVEIIGVAIHQAMAWREVKNSPESIYFEKNRLGRERVTQLLIAQFGEDEGKLWDEKVELVATSYARDSARCEPCPFAELTEVNPISQ